MFLSLFFFLPFTLSFLLQDFNVSSTPGNNETNSSYISSCSPFSSIMRGSSLHEEYESHWVGSTFVIF